MEKTIDKNIQREPYMETDEVKCPTCGKVIGYADILGCECPDKCPECGQVIDKRYLESAYS